jgi:hypothetical protein
MAGSVTTNLSNSFLAELMEAGHCFLPPQTGIAVTQSSTISGVLTTAIAGLAIGMAQTGTNAGAGAVIATLNPATPTNYTTSIASSGALVSATFTADVFKIALIASALAGNIAYGAGGVGSLTTNAGTPGTSTPSQANLGTDEQAASGTYAAGGLALANAALVQTNPINSAAIAFSTTIQWTSATLSVAGAMLYNTSTRLSAAAAPENNRVVAVYSFGGTQSVTSGTFTLTQPTQDGHTGLVRLSPN